jgi:hypothetical protein
MDPAIPRLASAGPARLIVGPFRAHKAPGDLSALRNLQVTGTNGTSILLSAVAELNLGSGPATIQRAGSDAEGHGRGRAQRRSARRSAERLRASLLVVGVARRPAHEPERTRPRPAKPSGAVSRPRSAERHLSCLGDITRGRETRRGWLRVQILRVSFSAGRRFCDRTGVG